MKKAEAVQLLGLRAGRARRRAQGFFDLDEGRLRPAEVKKCAGSHELELAKIFCSM